MVFDNNTHYNITSSTIPAAEGYDCSYGFGKMMIEGAINEYSMFEAMLAHDYQECFAMKNGYTNEAGKDDDNDDKTSDGIIQKVIAIIKKIIAKLKGIFDSFHAKMLAVIGNDAKLIEKYSGKLLSNKDEVDKIKVKWYPVKEKNYYKDFPKDTPWKFRSQNNDVEETEIVLVMKVLPKLGQCNSISEIGETVDHNIFDEQKELEIGSNEINGISSILGKMKNYSKNLEELKQSYSIQEELLNKEIKQLNTDKKGQAKLNTVYTAWGNAIGAYYGAINKACVKDYKQNRAAFVKAASSLNKNVKEESTLLDAIAEAAEDEVDEVINAAIDTNDSEEIANLTAASLNVLDSDVSKDPNELVYDKVDNYTDNADMDDHEGEIDVTINSREEEANLFSEMFY